MCSPRAFWLNVHMQIWLRDDLESLAYVLLFLPRGDLPWRQCAMRHIHASKTACTGTALGTNFPPEFGALLDCCRALGSGGCLNALGANPTRRSTGLPRMGFYP
ncbi:hypothetical protein B0H14DRAFT_2986316 [Mycena olivaceomarginata]|nr:hypothetical protein B0H14DRAFT_2986316 [Mycena olivaceomarginata]